MAKIMIGIPQHSGIVSTATMGSIHEAITRTPGHAVSYQCSGVSLLARNFNSLWISAYTRDYDYFILHHSDLGIQSPSPQYSWVSYLVDRLTSLGAAALSVCSPIKNKHGHFSAGLQLEPGNPYSLRRLTARELLRLPRSFIARQDVCGVFEIDPATAGAMLINTGCLIIDLKRFPWFELRWPGFEIKDEIVWNLSGVPMAVTAPEDWWYSIWLHEHGLPYYQTRALKLNHFGAETFTNQGEWGDEMDNSPRQPSAAKWRNTR